ncbi:MAG: radical SAM protein, partial [Desulfotomaculales bacterium]
LNPYHGCSHGCLYCYAGCMTRFSGLKEEWGSFVQVKSNFPERLAAQLKRPRQGKVMISSITDAYQPVEKKYGLTRACLKLLARTGLGVSILTKSDLVLRDLDILREMPRVTVGFTVTTADENLAGRLEPGAPPSARRLKAIEKLAGAGIGTWVFVAPVIPGLNDAPADVKMLIRAAKQAGAREIDFDPFNFYPSATARVKKLIDKNYPHARKIFEMAGRDPDGYARQVRALWNVAL